MDHQHPITLITVIKSHLNRVAVETPLERFDVCTEKKTTHVEAQVKYQHVTVSGETQSRHFSKRDSSSRGISLEHREEFPPERFLTRHE